MKMKKIDVRPATESSQAGVQCDAVALQSEVQKQLKQKRPQENEDCIKARKEPAEEITLTAVVEKTAAQVVHEKIDSLVNCLDVSESPLKKRILHSRPTNWETIAENANIYGNYSTIRTFQEVFSEATSITSNKRLSRWRKDLKDGKQPNLRTCHLAYSKVVDKELYDAAIAWRNKGLRVDNGLLRKLLLDILAKNGLMGLLRENGGKYTFGDSWSTRFFERNDMKKSMDNEDKEATYIDAITHDKILPTEDRCR